MPTFDLLGHLTFNLPITNVGDKASVEIILALFMQNLRVFQNVTAKSGLQFVIQMPSFCMFCWNQSKNIVVQKLWRKSVKKDASSLPLPAEVFWLP